MDANQEMPARMRAKTDVNLKEMKEEMRADQELLKEEMLAMMEARIEANNEKFEVLQDSLVSRMDVHHARQKLTMRS
jgi:hypothetical protein